MLFCISSATSCKNNLEGISITDSSSNTLTFDKIPERVVILESSIAKIYSLSGGSYIGISDDYSEYGLELGEATIVGTAHYPTLELIVGLNPDLVIYSNKKASHVSVAETLNNLNIKTYSCSIESFDDYLNTLKQFTTLLNRSDLYKTYGLDLETKINAIKEKAGSKEPVKVLFIRAMSTKYSVIGRDNFVIDMLNDLNTVNVCESSYITTELQTEYIVSSNPDFIFYTYMGDSNIETSKKFLYDNLFNKDFFKEMDAYKNGNIIELDPSLYHYKPNDKWDLAYLNLYNILYGEEK